MTEADIVKDILETDNITSLIRKECDYIFTRIEVSRWIRNTYRLWDADCELTFKHPEFKETIIDGVDYNPRHPDRVSADILDAVIYQLSKYNQT